MNLDDLKPGLVARGLFLAKPIDGSRDERGR
jgi:hypothetical protein